MDNPLTTLTPDELHPSDANRLRTSIVAPRPIARVITISAAGIVNLAPFSFFNAVGGAPPTVMFSCGQRKGQPVAPQLLRRWVEAAAGGATGRR